MTNRFSVSEGAFDEGSVTTSGSLATSSAHRGSSPGARWTRDDWIVLALVTLAGGLLRLARIWRPETIVFDEIHYAQDACLLVIGSADTCGRDFYASAHPPLGELLIAAGIALFGYDALGWRVAALVAGTLTIALTYLLARRLLGSTLGAAVASVLLAVDFLHFVHSRIAMLDIFVALFTTAAFTFAVLDRDALSDATAAGRSPGIFRGRWWRFAAGAAGGAAAACKWSGVLALVGVLLLLVAWEIAASLRERRGRPAAGAIALAFVRGAPSAFVALAVVPLLVYFASHLVTIDGEFLAAPWHEGSWVRNVVERQISMVRFHFTLQSHHPYESPGWSWLLIKQPVAYHFDTYRGDYQEILAMGNPLAWWPSIPALGFVIYRWLRSRTILGAETVIGVGFLVTLLPWIVVLGVRNAVFLFYVLPTVSFVCLAIAYLVRSVWHRRAGRIATGVYLAAVLAAFAFYYPVLAAVPTPPGAWQARILFNDCQTDAGFRAIPDDESSQGPAPPGWCWR